jgi:DNA replication protein DnaC
VIIAGSPGCGKSFAVWALKNDMDKKPQLIEDNASGDYKVYINSDKRNIKVIDASFFTEIQFCSFEEKDKAMLIAKEADVLCIDDLGMETQNEKNSGLIEIIINERYNNERTTFITTNLSLEEFKKRYSERIIDRLREWGIFFECKLKSYRQKLKSIN